MHSRGRRYKTSGCSKPTTGGRDQTGNGRSTSHHQLPRPLQHPSMTTLGLFRFWLPPPLPCLSWERCARTGTVGRVTWLTTLTLTGLATNGVHHRPLYLDGSASCSPLQLSCLSRERRGRAGPQDRLILHMQKNKARLEKLALYRTELACPAPAGG